MASFGGKTIRALLKGANDGAGRTQIADLAPLPGVGAGPPPGMEGLTHRGSVNANYPQSVPQAPMNEMDYSMGLRDFTANNPGLPGAKPSLNPLAQSNELPWKKISPGDTVALEEELMALINAQDEKGLKTFSRKHFGVPWKLAQPSVEDYFGLNDFGGML